MKLEELEKLASEGRLAGRVDGLSNEDYHASSPISRSDIMKAMKSYEHYEANISPNPDSPALRMGSAFHCLVLEPNKFGEEFAIEPDVNRRTKDGRAKIEEFKKLNSHRTILKPDEIKEVAKWARAALAYRINFKMGSVSINATMKEIRDSGEWTPEVSFFGKINEVMCKARADMIKNDNSVIIDLKSARDITPYKWGMEAIEHGLDVQAVHYMAITGSTMVIFLCVEKSYPYIARSFYFYDEELFGVARVHAEALKRIKYKERSPSVTGLRLSPRAGDLERRLGW
jgi:exodeoxyribonuclease VIII